MVEKFKFPMGSRSAPVVTPPGIEIFQRLQKHRPDQAWGYTSTLFHAWLPDHPAKRISDLLPWAWKASQRAATLTQAA